MRSGIDAAGSLGVGWEDVRKNRVVEQNRCYHLVSRLAHRAFFLDDEEKDRAVALMRRVEAGVQAIMSYCVNRTVSAQTLLPPFSLRNMVQRNDLPQSIDTKKPQSGLILCGKSASPLTFRRVL